MATRNDQVFQLSLTEIAFTVAFILLLLLGYVVFKEQSDRLAAEERLSDIQSAARASESLNTAKADLAAELKRAGVSDPDAVITKLVANESVAAERDRLKKRVEDLDERLTALSELQAKVHDAAQAEQPEIIKQEAVRALSFTAKAERLLRDAKPVLSSPAKTKNMQPPPTKASQDELLDQMKNELGLAQDLRKALKRQLKPNLHPGEEAEAMKSAISAAERYAELGQGGRGVDSIQKENSDLRGQVAFLKNRLDARGGRDYPPCWADETGKVEFLFSIELGSGSITVSPAWPRRRDSVANEIPGVTAAVSAPVSYQQFAGVVQPILDWSKKQDPECRHYVQLKSSISDAVQSDRARLMVENFFYKVEARR